MKNTTIIVIALVAILAFLLGSLFSGLKREEPVNATTENLRVAYIFPSRCIECKNLQFSDPKMCQKCDTYDTSIPDLASQEIGVNIEKYVGDMVSEPSIFVTKGKIAFLGNAKNVPNIAAIICAVVNNESHKSCVMVNQIFESMRSCLTSRVNMVKSAIMYHYSSVGCDNCKKSNDLIKELENLTYEDIPYSVVWIDDKNDSQMSILKDCNVNRFMDLQYTPQVFCIANGRSQSGEINSLSELRDFADLCIKMSK